MKHNKNTGRRSPMGRAAATVLALVLILGAAVGGTLAYLVTQTNSLTNTFEPSHVSCAIEETFNGTTKSDVIVQNTGDIDAYIRAKVVITWKDNDGNVYAAAPEENRDYTISYNESDWTENGGYWYYNSAVTPEKSTNNLINTCALTANSAAPAGYALSVEILAEAIQAEPAAAVQEAWHVTIGNGGVTAVGAN